jgi:hypothetical protein
MIVLKSYLIELSEEQKSKQENKKITGYEASVPTPTVAYLNASSGKPPLQLWST